MTERSSTNTESREPKQDTAARKVSKFKMALRALRHRNYRLFFAGQLISLIGTWMQMIAQPWLVYRLTGSSLLLGTVGFASQIPVFLLATLGGNVADRYNRHRIVIATQTAAMTFLGTLLPPLRFVNSYPRSLWTKPVLACLN